MTAEVKDPAATYLRRRRAAVMAHATAIGVDWAEVAPGASPSQRLLTLHFIPATAANQAKLGVLATVTPAQVRLTVGGQPPGTSLQVTAVSAVTTAADPQLKVTLTLGASGPLAVGGTPMVGVELTGISTLDPFFARASVSLDPAPRDADCLPVCPPSSPPPVPDVPIDYQARDYVSFRRLMIDRLTTLLPDWSEESPADLWVTLVELLADAADQVSYFQDAVATEAYLGTARLRVSVRRHARLAGYPMHEGASARVWVQLQTSSAAGVTVPAGTAVLSRLPGVPLRLNPESPELAQALAASPIVFETLHAVTVYAAHATIPLYDWGAPEYGLATGATAATLRGRFPNLAVGDVLALAEVKGPATGLADDADPRHRQAVRLTAVTLGQDILAASGPQDVTEVEWRAEDALTSALCISTVLPAGAVTGISAAFGNLVLADDGRTVTAESLGTVPPTGTPFRPVLALPDLTFRRPYDHTAALAGGAAAVFAGERVDALPAVSLADPQRSWAPRYDLLSSAPTDAAFVVEMDDDRRAHLRFGNGVQGLAPVPGQTLTATYRVGNGSAGNIGPDSLAHVVSADAALLGATNPLPGQGGTDPEPLDTVRLAAPQVFHETDDDVTTAEFARLAETYPDVARAAASLQWTGSWHTLFLGVERASGSPVDDAFKAGLAGFLESERIAGWEVEVGALRYVGLDIAMTVTLEPGASRGQMEAGLKSAFGNRDLPDGRRGFFHPANFTFGQPVYLSRVIAAALAVPGVAAVDLDETPPKPNRFRRYGEPPRGELARGEIPIGGLEIARLDNDPAAPQLGRIRFFLEGGR